MLRSANEFKDFSIGATDGDIGWIEGFYFDDRQWTVRYIIVNTGGWFNESKVLVSPYAIDGITGTAEQSTRHSREKK